MMRPQWRLCERMANGLVVADATTLAQGIPPSVCETMALTHYHAVIVPASMADCFRRCRRDVHTVRCARTMRVRVTAHVLDGDDEEAADEGGSNGQHGKGDACLGVGQPDLRHGQRHTCIRAGHRVMSKDRQTSFQCSGCKQ